MQRIILAVIGLVLLTGCNPKSYTVPTASMEPTFKRGSHVVADTTYYTHNPIQRFDVVVVKAPDGKHKYVKRVIGLGNETVQIQGGKVIVNSRELKESFTSTSPTKEFGPLALPAGQYFLLGDNRPNSLDSRNWKPPTVGQDAIVGKVIKIPTK